MVNGYAGFVRKGLGVMSLTSDSIRSVVVVRDAAVCQSSTISRAILFGSDVSGVFMGG